MTWSDLQSFRAGWQSLGSALPFIMGGISVAILLGCAVASWLCPSRKEDCMFHRHVM